MNTLTVDVTRKQVIQKKTGKSFFELSDLDKERTVYNLVNMHFKKHNSVKKTTEFWQNIYDTLKHHTFIQNGKYWYPENLNQILNS